jgi:hypothetical protein
MNHFWMGAPSAQTSSNRTQKQLGNPTFIEATSVELAAIVSVGAISFLGGRALAVSGWL